MRDVESILNELGIPYRGIGQDRHCSSGWVQLSCPWCQEARGSYHLGVNLQHATANCWKCGPHSFVDVLFQITKLSLSKCIELSAGILTPKNIELKKVRGKIKLPSAIGPLGPVHQRYLKRRGFPPDTLYGLWGVRGIGLSSRFPWSLFIPNIQSGETVSWTTRSTNSNGSRYISANPDEESVSPRDVLFGEDYCRNAVVICEGPFDVFRIGPGAAALMGASASNPQIAKIIQYPLRVVCLDGDKQSARRASILCEHLSQYPGETVNVRLDSSDPGEASDKAVKEIRDTFLDEVS